MPDPAEGSSFGTIIVGVMDGDVTGGITFDGSLALFFWVGFLVLVGTLFGVAVGAKVFVGCGVSVGAGVLVSVGCSPWRVGVNVIPMGLLGLWAITGSGKVMMMNAENIKTNILRLFFFIIRPCPDIYL